MRDTIKEVSGTIIGYIDTDINGDKIGYDFYLRIVGHYYRSRNVTTDFYGRIVSYGDSLISLVWQAKDNK